MKSQNENQSIIDQIFDEKDGKYILNMKELEEVSVSEDDPTKTIAEIKREKKAKVKGFFTKAGIVALYLVLGVLFIVAFPVVLLALVFIMSNDWSNKKQSQYKKEAEMKELMKKIETK